VSRSWQNEEEGVTHLNEQRIHPSEATIFSQSPLQLTRLAAQSLNGVTKLLNSCREGVTQVF
jgi:hypothetical protein